MSRLEQLLRFVEEDPSDPFNTYAVAVEYLKLDSEKAAVFFETLLREHPFYVPTYYTYGKLLQGDGTHQRAKDVFEKGVSVALKAGDQKAIGELQNALSELAFEME